MIMVEWYVYAIVAMLFFSFANIALKQILTDDFMSLLQQNFNSAVLPSLAIVFLGIVAAYFLFLSKMAIPQAKLILIIAFLMLAAMGFISMMVAVNTGKIAPVTAILSTSSIAVAVLSLVVLQDSLSLREWTGIVLAFAGVLVLIYK